MEVEVVYALPQGEDDDDGKDEDERGDRQPRGFLPRHE